MRRHWTSWVVATAAFAAAWPCSGQEMADLQKRLPQKLNVNRPATREAISGLLHYPKDVRNAALELAQYPDLVINLRYAENKSPASVDAMAKGYPAAVQQAAALLSTRGDVLATLQQNLLALSVIGRAYAQDRAGVGFVVDQLSQAEAMDTKAAVDGWAKRMSLNPAAAQQLSAACEELARVTGGMNFGGMGLPNPQQVQFILDHPDRYGELGVEVLDQWGRGGNPEPFRQSVDLWYAGHREYMPEELYGDAAFKLKLLKESMAFEQRYAEAVAKTQFGSAPTRTEFLESNEKEFPSLVEVREAREFAVANAKPVKVAGGPWTGSSGSGGRGGSSSRGSSPTSSMMGSSRSSRSSQGTSSGIFATGGGSRNRNSRNSSSRNSSSRGGSSSSSNRRNSGSGSNNGGFGGTSGFGSGGSGFGGGGFGGGGSGFGGGGSGFGGGGSSFGGSNFGGNSSNGTRSNSRN